MLRDTLLIYRSELTVTLRNRPYIMIGVMQPMLYLVLFGPLLASLLVRTPGVPSTSWLDLTPGLVIQLALTNGIFGGYTVLHDLKSGVLERLRVTPTHRTALSLGKVLTSMTLTLVQGTLIITLAALFFDVKLTVVGVVLTLLIAGLVALGLTSCSNALAIRIKNEEAFTSIINMTILPIMLLSGILLPITYGKAPLWLFILSRFNPLSYVVEISRASFRGILPVGAVLTGAVVLLAATGLAVWWGGRTFQRDSL